MTAHAFKLSGQYYDLIYKNKDYISESNYVNSLIRRFNPNALNILEFGCGTGKHAKILAGEGFVIHGVDKSVEMVKEANTSDCFTSEVGDISIDKIFGSFDVVLALFHVVSYQCSNNAVIATFRNAYQNLEEGGIFIFDVWYSPAVYSIKPEARLKKLEDHNLQIIRFADPVIHPNSNIVDVRYTINVHNLFSEVLHSFEESHLMRHFSIPEISMLAHFTGFQIMLVEQWLTGKVPSEETWGVCFVLQKK